ncbi:unnamed protein product [Rhizophagus irregularis]|nr:unnamed protein product [Rhizophagus irregularis]
MKLLNVSFRPALKQCDVIPATQVIDFPEEYVLPDIDRSILRQPDFDVDKLEEIIKEQRNKKQQNAESLKIRNHPLYRLSILGEPYVSADPEFVVDMRKKILVAVEDKHLRNVYSTSNFGETQLTAEVLACGNENAVITKEYWEELGEGLPNNQSVIIERWPGENGLKTGVDLADPDGRRSVLRALIRIRETLTT